MEEQKDDFMQDEMTNVKKMRRSKYWGLGEIGGLLQSSARKK